jgi:hypothetical protein
VSRYRGYIAWSACLWAACPVVGLAHPHPAGAQAQSIGQQQVAPPRSPLGVTTALDGRWVSTSLTRPANGIAVLQREGNAYQLTGIVAAAGSRDSRLLLAVARPRSARLIDVAGTVAGSPDAALGYVLLGTIAVGGPRDERFISATSSQSR